MSMVFLQSHITKYVLWLAGSYNHYCDPVVGILMNTIKEFQLPAPNKLFKFKLFSRLIHKALQLN